MTATLTLPHRPAQGNLGPKRTKEEKWPIIKA